MTARQSLQAFQQYQQSRLSFVQSIAELASRGTNISILAQEGVLGLLKPLINDPCQQIQQCATIALGRIVHRDKNLAEQVLHEDFLNPLLKDIKQQNKYYRKTCTFVLRSLCKHNEEMALSVINQGGLEALVIYLEDFETVVKHGAVLAISFIAEHSSYCAQHVLDFGVVPLLVLCLQEPDVCVKQASTAALYEIAKHNEEMAQNIVDAGSVGYLVRNLKNHDEKSKKQTLLALDAIAKHSSDLAEVVVEAEIFPMVLYHMAHTNQEIRKLSAVLVRDVVKHSLELAELVVNTGGLAALLETIRQPNIEPEDKIPSITALGYIAGHSSVSAMAIVNLEGVVELASILSETNHDATLSVTTWTLGQLGKHSPEHSHAVAVTNVFPRLLQLYNNEKSSEDLRHKCKTALKDCLQKCLLLSALEPLLYDAPSCILKYILGQYSKVLPNDPKARRLFVTTGGLKKVQEIEAEPGSTLMEYITVINACFPEELIRYYSPGYPDSLLEQVEQYTPQLMTLLREINVDGDMQTDVTLNKSSSTSSSGATVKN